MRWDRTVCVSFGESASVNLNMLVIRVEPIAFYLFLEMEWRPCVGRNTDVSWQQVLT